MQRIIIALAASLLIAGCGRGQEKLDSEGRAACLAERDHNLGITNTLTFDQDALKRGAYSSHEAVARTSIDFDSALDDRAVWAAFDSPTSQSFINGEITAAEADAINAPKKAKFDAAEEAFVAACDAAGVDVDSVKAVP
jgi:hypothetical protein